MEIFELEIQFFSLVFDFFSVINTRYFSNDCLFRLKISLSHYVIFLLMLLARAIRFELILSDLKADVLPLNYTPSGMKIKFASLVMNSGMYLRSFLSFSL